MEFVLLVMGIILLLSGVHIYHLENELKKYGFHTKGEVVKVEGEWVRSAGKQVHFHFPVVRFTDAANQLVERKLESGGDLLLIPVKGHELQIIYYQEKLYPADSGKHWWSTILIVGGSVAIILFFFAYWTNA